MSTDKMHQPNFQNSSFTFDFEKLAVAFLMPSTRLSGTSPRDPTRLTMDSILRLYLLNKVDAVLTQGSWLAPSLFPELSSFTFGAKFLRAPVRVVSWGMENDSFASISSSSCQCYKTFFVCNDTSGNELNCALENITTLV